MTGVPMGHMDILETLCRSPGERPTRSGYIDRTVRRALVSLEENGLAELVSQNRDGNLYRPTDAGYAVTDARRRTRAGRLKRSRGAA